MPNAKKTPPLGDPGSPLDSLLDWLERDHAAKKKSHSLYLSVELFQEFAAACKPYGKKPSKVVEYLMQAFINASKARKP